MKKDKHFKNKEEKNKEDSIINEKEEAASENQVSDFEILESLKEENQKLKDELLRVMAESENIKKRCAAEIDKNNKYAISSFAKDLLVVADDLDRALGSVLQENNECESIIKGVELTKQELTHVFEKFGITKMDILDKPFDPNFHQVIQQISDPSKPSGTVVAELQSGYMINGRILREAMVVVSKE